MLNIVELSWCDLAIQIPVDHQWIQIPCIPWYSTMVKEMDAKYREVDRQGADLAGVSWEPERGAAEMVQ